MQGPILVEDYRIGFVIKGEIKATVNLLHKSVKPGDMRYKQSVDTQRSQDGSNNNHEIFNRFIYLVNKFAKEERSIGFYADKMCLSPRYLSTVIGQHSGQTAKEWIDQATINHAKVLLCHTEKSISQIADALKFPNDSFFCKYFRRLTGVSPTEYRQNPSYISKSRQVL